MTASRRPPGPTGKFLGLSLVREFAVDPLGFITRLGRTYGDMAWFRMGPVRAFLVNHPDLIREVLVTKAKCFVKERRTLDTLRQVDGEGLVVTEGDFWLRQRRLLQPAFSSKRFAGYADEIVAKTARRLEGWLPGQTLNVVDEMTNLTLEIIAKAFYDVELTGQTALLGEAVRVLSQAFYRELSNPFRLPDWLPLPAARRKRRAIESLHGLIDGIIAERRALGSPDRGDLLSMLLLAVDDEGDGKGMSDRQARDEAATMFNAGHDSTAAALAWLWYLVARNSEIEARLIAEARAVLGGRPATSDDVPRLVFTDCVVREALRLYPPVWSLMVRVAQEDVEIGGYLVPKGHWVYMFPWVTQRDARFFENPETFDPDRWMAGRVEKIPQYGWIPFGAGPHVCIGQALALAEMTLIVSTVLQRFRLEFAPNQPRDVAPEPLLAIRPRGGLRMVVKAIRSGNAGRSGLNKCET
ncbi:MAG: cytochrome P450 [Planctomycetaceae bacterium]